MKQETINKNKLPTILCAIALTLGVLVSAVLFSVTPVHAAESIWILKSNGGEYFLDTEWNLKHNDGSVDNYKKHDVASLPIGNVYYAFVEGRWNTDYISLRLYKFTIGSTSVSIYQNTNKYISTTFNDNGEIRQNVYNGFWGSDEMCLIENGENRYFGYKYNTDLPVFNSSESMLQYCLYGDKSGLIVPELPNNTDEKYSFTGFTLNGKTARWTGTTERSYAKEVAVEEYVKVSYAWATTTEPDNLGELQSYDGEFPTSDKRLTLPWSEMENGKTDFQFIRQVKIFPCYRVPHLAYYIGQPVTIYYNTDGSIDKISNPNTPGVLDDSIPIPVLSVNNDKGTFLFANAQNNYKFELKGRFWSTDDFYVFRKMPSLVWQYKYLTLLKNSLTTWVSVGDNMSTLSTYSFGDLGKESWNDLLDTYPIENRNIITGEQQGWLSWANITGYNDAITTLKTLLSTPYSLFNGYEVYVRYYVVCDDGSIKYSKWTHYFNNLADADGSTGSIVDDASNMNNGSQSDKGLTDSDMDNVENSGNSRNDVDAKPSNDFSVEISDITGLFNQFINILKSLYSGMGQLPSLVNAIFGFLPSWASSMIGISLVVIIILRIIGR